MVRDHRPVRSLTTKWLLFVPGALEPDCITETRGPAPQSALDLFNEPRLQLARLADITLDYLLQVNDGFVDLVLENEYQRHLLTLSHPLDEGATHCGNGPDDRMLLNLDPSRRPS